MRTLVFVLSLLPAAAFADVHYALKPMPSAKAIAVTVRLDKPGATETFRIPAWCPGFYFIQKYQDKLFDVTATAPDGTALRMEKVDERGWRVHNPQGKPITFAYKVLGDDGGLGFFGVNVREDKAFVNGPAAFVYVEGRKEERAHLQLELPQKWGVATGMTKGPDGRWTSENYDEFIDHPLQLGAFERRTFKVRDYEFEAVFVSPNNQFRPNLDQQTETLRRVSVPAIELFGSAPFKRYVYLVHLAVGSFGGGLEHRASTVMAMPNTADLDLTTLAAHEFFHTWNVKHIRPKVLGPFDYTKPVRTGNLWFAEGVTDYYANLIAYRANTRDSAWLLQTLTGEIANLQNSRSRLSVTLEDASRRAWEHGGFGVGDLDYYNKGLVAGLVLDAAIRGATDGAKSLDDVMRVLYARYHLPKPGFEEDALRTTINEVAGADLSELYHQIARSTREMPYEALAAIGLKLYGPGRLVPTLGFRTANSVVVRATDEAIAAGIRIGDVVVGRVDGTDADQTVTVRVRRAGGERDIRLPLAQAATPRWSLEEDPLATVAARARLGQWLARG